MPRAPSQRSVRARRKPAPPRTAPTQRAAPAPRAAATLRPSPAPRAAPTLRPSPAPRAAPTPHPSPAPRAAPTLRTDPPAQRTAPAAPAAPAVAREPLLGVVGARVRQLRAGRGQTRRDLAQASGLSERFLADLEAGTGNISLERLAQLGRALGTTSAALLAHAEDVLQLRRELAADPDLAGRLGVAEAPPALELPGPLRALLGGLNRDELQEAQRWLRARFGSGAGPLVALLGLRGAGKSTIGAKLAQRLGVPFVELDELVERAAGLSLESLFSLHGEAYYRRLAREVLTSFLADAGAAVLATGGSVVTDREALRLLQKRCRTVWLKATPEEHWQRVLAQGDVRPGAASPQAQAELRALLRAREPLYAQAELAVDTSRLDVAAAVDEIASALSRPRGS